MPEMHCPDDAELMPLVCDEPGDARIRDHVKKCVSCSKRVAQLRKEVKNLSSLKFPDPRPNKTTTVYELDNRGRPHPTNRLPATIGRYRIVAELDRGGQGIVYRAIAPHLAQELVIKLSKNPLDAAAPERDRLLAEGKLLAELDHPNLVRVYDLDFFEGRPFLVLAYVRGVNLRQHAASGLDDQEIARLLARVARALAAAHARGVLHLDLKPQNIVINPMGEPVLIDFGLAQLRDAWSPDEDRAHGGTPAFMAPEQACELLQPLETGTASPSVGASADIFGLGAVLYCLLTGTPPFAAANSQQSLELASRCQLDIAALDDPDVAKPLADICRRALQQDPLERFASADQMAKALEEVGNRPAPDRRWTVGFLITLAILAIAVIVTVIVWPHIAPLPPARPSGKPEVTFRAARPLLDAANGNQSKRGEFLDLQDNLPVTNEHLLRLHALMPRNYQVGVFVFTADDGLLRVPDAELSVKHSDGTLEISLPRLDAREFHLTAARGACLILVCARRGGPIETRELAGLLEPATSWTDLPEDDSCIAFNMSETWLPNARGLDFSDAPEKPMMKRIDLLRQEMAARFDFIQGVVFHHD